MAQERQCFGGAVDHGMVASVSCDQGLVFGTNRNLLRPAVVCAAKADLEQSVGGV